MDMEEEMRQSMEEGIKRSMENAIGEVAVDKEKVSFLKGYKKGIAESYQPNLKKLVELVEEKKLVEEFIEEMTRNRDFTMRMQNSVIDKLIQEFE